VFTASMAQTMVIAMTSQSQRRDSARHTIPLPTPRRWRPGESMRCAGSAPSERRHESRIGSCGSAREWRTDDSRTGSSRHWETRAPPQDIAARGRARRFSSESPWRRWSESGRRSRLMGAWALPGVAGGSSIRRRCRRSR
jgi:hypothetical protein